MLSTRGPTIQLEFKHIMCQLKKTGCLKFPISCLRGIGNKSRGYIIKQSVVAVHAIVDAIAYGELSAVDPDRWEEIPDRGGFISTSDKWPNEWAE